jgi:hypothetical protein
VVFAHAEAKTTPRRRGHAEETDESGHCGGLISGARGMRIRITQKQSESIQYIGTANDGVHGIANDTNGTAVISAEHTVRHTFHRRRQPHQRPGNPIVPRAERV